MPDSRRHRGAHPEDAELFAPDQLARLEEAQRDLSWLRTRGYAEVSATKLVGDRYQLRTRQRVAVGRCACSDQKLESRLSRLQSADQVRGKDLLIDGLNVLTTIEVVLSKGVLLLGRDGCMRDMASFHGNYRLVDETGEAIAWLLESVSELGPATTSLLVDRPVSNSGRLARRVREQAENACCQLDVIVTERVDEKLQESKAVVASADSAVLDLCGLWTNLARMTVERNREKLDSMWLLELGDDY